MDQPLPEDFDPYDRGDMRIEGADIPKSTVTVAVILWGVLAGLGAWTLTMVSDMRAEVRGQGRDIDAANGRIDNLERRVGQSESDIRELQRTRK